MQLVSAMCIVLMMTITIYLNAQVVESPPTMLSLNSRMARDTTEQMHHYFPDRYAAGSDEIVLTPIGQWFVENWTE
jgi:hypothetical protein